MVGFVPMSEQKIVAVIGATGYQGGGLVRAILNDPDGGFAVRAITSDPSSAKAKALLAQGCEVVQGNWNDKESLMHAFKGAFGVYCVTNFYETFSPEGEMKQAKNMAEAAKEASVQHVIWSTQEDTRRWIPIDDDSMPTLMGNYKVPHFDAKGESDTFFEELRVPTTYFLTPFYFENIVTYKMGPQRTEEGSLVFNLPLGDKKLPSIAAEDIGKSAYGIFKRGPKLIGKYVGVAAEQLSGAEMASQMSEVVGETVVYKAVPYDVYRGFGSSFVALGNTFQFFHDFQDYFLGARPVESTRELNPQLTSFKDWLAANKNQIIYNPANETSVAEASFAVPMQFNSTQ
ncbi:nmrA-like family domain-containing protein 1 [Symsagittifera roscoffensis]|uniref:nmrA-like family domain-containing protein 1 n=1 Tax=Symsagittifera roscoffensis TaxID=84072 RepID=UPI00307B3A93